MSFFIHFYPESYDHGLERVKPLCISRHIWFKALVSDLFCSEKINGERARGETSFMSFSSGDRMLNFFRGFPFSLSLLSLSSLSLSLSLSSLSLCVPDLHNKCQKEATSKTKTVGGPKISFPFRAG